MFTRVGVEDLMKDRVEECVYCMLCVLALTPPCLSFVVTFAKEERILFEGKG